MGLPVCFTKLRAYYEVGVDAHPTLRPSKEEREKLCMTQREKVIKYTKQIITIDIGVMLTRIVTD